MGCQASKASDGVIKAKNLESFGHPIEPLQRQIIDYWYGTDEEFNRSPEQTAPKSKIWFGGGPEVDKYLTEKYSTHLENLHNGQFDHWK